ncbi:DoxX family protein [Pseudonocardia sp. NPDC049154]|uniref:DoxX family protein n=1 Tax=Pseudonocardia sp. NPDC049154 TaxID=3155501 RepID=UPI0033C3BA5B
MSTIDTTRALTRRTTDGTTDSGATGIREAAPQLVLLAFRVVVGFLYSLHAVMGFGLFGGVDGAGTGLPPFTLYWWVSLVELVGAVLVAIGLYVRPTGFLLSGMMAFAYFAMHLPQGWNPIYNLGEPAALYSWIFLLLCAIGGGRYSLDHLRTRRAR